MVTSNIVVVDYNAGNLQSVLNALEHLQTAHTVISAPERITENSLVILPGVGSFEFAVKQLKALNLFDAICTHLRANRPYIGICVGLQLLAESSEECLSDETRGFGILPCKVLKLQASPSVPHIGWNSLCPTGKTDVESWMLSQGRMYFVHSYQVPVVAIDTTTTAMTTRYGSEEFVSFMRQGNISGTQFHPEKSGTAGLNVLRKLIQLTLQDLKSPPLASLSPDTRDTDDDGAGRHQTRYDQMGLSGQLSQKSELSQKSQLAKRLIACLDVRENDAGKLVVTKGNQYNVREDNQVRDFGDPANLAEKYYKQGADELTFLSIKSYNKNVLTDNPLLRLISQTAKRVFVPLCVGGGIRNVTDGRAVDIAAAYFLAGADKVSIGSDAVDSAERFYQQGRKDGTSSIEEIAERFGKQAVVISIDAQRVVIAEDQVDLSANHRVVVTHGSQLCWYRCTTKGGREQRELDVVQLVRAVEELGAGEILLNCIDQDGTNQGFDLDLLKLVAANTSLPVIASSGAGNAEHFVEAFKYSDAALAAGIFHRNELGIEEIKGKVAEAHLPVRA